MFKQDEIGVAGLLRARRRAAARRGHGLRFAARRHEAIAEAADGLNDVVAAERLEQLAQPAVRYSDMRCIGRQNATGLNAR